MTRRKTPADPPHDIRAERALLGCCIADPDAVTVAMAEGLAAQDFYVPDNQKIFAAVLAVIEAKATPDLITVTEQLGQDLERVGGTHGIALICEEHVTSVNAGHHARTVRDHSRRRKLLETAERLTAAAADPSKPIGETANEFRSALNSITDSPKKSAKLPKVTVREDADIPSRMWQALADSDVRVKKTFDGQRKDLKSKEAHDFALAGFAAALLWPAQRITDLIVSRRVAAGLPIKNAEYYAKIVYRVTQGTEAETGLEEAHAFFDREVGDGKDGNRDEIIEHLSAILGTNITRAIKYATEPASYAIETEKGVVHIGGVVVLQSPKQFQGAWYDGTAFWIDDKYLVKVRFSRFIRVISLLIENVDVGPENSTAGQMREWLREYIMLQYPVDRGILTYDQAYHANTQDICKPFFMTTGIAINGRDFRGWIDSAHREKITGQQMGKDLRRIGADSVVMNRKQSGTSTYNWLAEWTLLGIKPTEGEHLSDSLRTKEEQNETKERVISTYTRGKNSDEEELF